MLLNSMRTDPLVTTIIPTYNRAHLVSEAIESVLNQSYKNVEVVVVDDGSTDETQAVLAKYRDRVRSIRQENAGPAAARNRGIANSTGALIAFLDSDDLWLPNKLERQVALLQKAGPSVPCCVCNIRMRWPEQEKHSFEIAALHPQIAQGIWVNADEVLATRFLLFNQGVVIRREVLDRVGGYDENLWLLEDHELALRLSLEGPWAFLQEPLVIWRETATGSLYQSAEREEIRWKEPLVQILEKHLIKLNAMPAHQRLRRYVGYELGSARRQLKAAKVAQVSSWGATIEAKALRTWERYRRAFFIRSPWFPKMKIESVNI